LNITYSSGPRPASPSSSLTLSCSSAAALCGLWMSTSGSMMGTSPAAMICLATANCCATSTFTPEPGCLTTERILVPKMFRSRARANNAPRPGIGFITCTPLISGASPLSTLRMGTMPFSSHR